MQVAEKHAFAAGRVQGERIRFYAVAPGLLKTAFAKDPKDGAELVARLAVDEKGAYEGRTFWQFEEGEMRIVPW